MKKILVLGGTNFLGRHFIESILDRKDIELTLFNRQQTNQHLFQNINKIKGDREANEIDDILNSYWDVVIDFSSYYPLSLEYLVENIKEKVGRYIFISTCSVYDFKLDDSIPLTEKSPLVTCTEAEKSDTTISTYGKRKVACEQVFINNPELDSIILRPSIVFGKYDYTDRYYYWLYRIMDRKAFFLPDDGINIMTLTYIEDLTNTIIKALEIEQHQQFYNVASHQPEPLHQMLERINPNLNSISIDKQQLDDDHILKKQVFPLSYSINLSIDNSRLLEDFNLKCIPWDEAIQTTKKYYKSLGWNAPNIGISRKEELNIIQN